MTRLPSLATIHRQVRRSAALLAISAATGMLAMPATAASPGPADKNASPLGGPVPAVAGAVSADAPDEPARPRKGPGRERDYFARWHTPHGAVLERSVLDRMWREVRALPAEGARGRSTDPWTFMGPWGMSASGTARYSGRLLDFDDNGPTLRFASASGGLWEYALFIPVTLTEGLSSQAIGSVATDPNDADHLFVGTGEGHVRGGTGLHETWNGGADWTPVALPISPSAFYRIRYVPGRPTHLFAATNAGLVKSTDNGASWTYEMSGDVPDVVIWPHDPDRMWAGRWNDGVYSSTDAGDSWTKVLGAGLPTTNVGRVALTIHSGFPAILYASVARNDNDLMYGVYRSLGGLTWTDVSPPQDIFQSVGGQGDYDNAIAVNPANWQEVLVGGVTTWRTDDGGGSWSQVQDPDMHADVHAILWRSDTEVWVGHDGGFCYSNDAGVTWASDIDVLPTVQYYDIDVGKLEPTVMGGGTQDNGISMTVDGATWSQQIPQDGSDFVVDVTSPVQNVWATWGPRGGDWLFPPTRTTNRGSSWDVMATGIDPNQQWFTEIMHDRVDPVYLYSNADRHVYLSTDAGGSWDEFNTTPFPWNVETFEVSQWQPGGSSVWAATASGQTHQLWVWSGSAWNDRSPGLPNGRRIRRIATAAYGVTDAYVLMQGITSGQQIYRTTDLGLTWTNVTGDLPAVPVGDIVEHPTDPQRLYLGTEAGCFRSTSGGSSWERWNHGMPEANIVTDLATVDSLAAVGRFYVVAGTYGRGLWMREVGNDDPTGVAELREERAAVQLGAPRPNPVRGAAVVEFSLREAATVRLTAYDVAGRRVADLASGRHAAGSHRVEVDTARWAAGAYFVRLEASGRSVARRMLVVK